MILSFIIFGLNKIILHELNLDVLKLYLDVTSCNFVKTRRDQLKLF